MTQQDMHQPHDNKAQPPMAPDPAAGLHLTPWQGVVLGWIGLLALAFFHWLPSSYWRMVGWPWILIWQAGFLSLGIWLVWMLRQFNTPFRPLGYGLDWLLGVTALVMVLSAVVAPFPLLALWNVVFAAGFGLLIYSTRNWLSVSPPLQRWWWLGLCLTGIITGVISLVLWRPNEGMFAVGNFAAAIRNSRPLGHHNFVGGYLVLILPLVFAFAQAHKGWQRWLGWLGVAVLMVGVLVSGSRGAALGFLVWLGVTLITLVLQSKGAQRRTMVAMGLVAVLVVSAGLLANPRTRDLITNFRASDDGPVEIATIGDGPTRDRLFMMQIGVNIIKDRPILGVGPGQMVRVSDLYRPIAAGRGLSGIQQLHNTPVHIMGELGLAGLGLYLAFIAVVGLLWWRLVRTAQGADRTLAYGIGGGFLAYGIASLTDYQLENIGIASFLSLYLVTLVHWGDQYHLQPLSPLPIRLRRLLSLLTLALLAAIFSLWLPVTGALYFGRSAIQAFNAGRYGDAERQWDVAAEMHRYDPTYDAIAAQQMLELRSGLEAEEDQQLVTNIARQRFSHALALAPNDFHFNQNLAVLNWPDAPDNAEIYASRAVQLLPRNNSYTYYLLARIYLAQGRPQAAQAALLLQSLTNPEFLTMPVWDTPPLAELEQQVVTAFVAEYADLLRTISPQSNMYASLYEPLQIVCWWHQQSCPADLPPTPLRPIVQAILIADQDPDQASAFVEQTLATADTVPIDEHESLLLLQLWLDPDTDIETYMQADSTDMSADEMAAIRQHIAAHRTLADWLTSVSEPLSSLTRNRLDLGYRNQLAASISLGLVPEGLNQQTMVHLLRLFRVLPREVPSLENRIEALRTQALGLPHPSRNQFQLSHSLADVDYDQGVSLEQQDHDG